MAQKLQDNFYARCPPEKRPLYMQGSGSSSESSVSDAKQETKSDDPKAKKQKSPYDSSLGKALHGTFFTPFWTAGVLLFIAGSCSLHCLHLRLNVFQRNVENDYTSR